MTKQEQIEAIISKSCNENAIALSEVEIAIIALDLLKSGLIAFDNQTTQEKEIEKLKAENKQLKTECALLDDELRIARQETIDVLNKLKTKAFDKDAFNGWAGSTFVVLVRDIDEMIAEVQNADKD